MPGASASGAGAAAAAIAAGGGGGPGAAKAVRSCGLKREVLRLDDARSAAATGSAWTADSRARRRPARLRSWRRRPTSRTPSRPWRPLRGWRGRWPSARSIAVEITRETASLPISCCGDSAVMIAFMPSVRPPMYIAAANLSTPVWKVASRDFAASAAAMSSVCFFSAACCAASLLFRSSCALCIASVVCSACRDSSLSFAIASLAGSASTLLAAIPERTTNPASAPTAKR